jgi:hypothetical protein
MFNLLFGSAWQALKQTIQAEQQFEGSAGTGAAAVVEGGFAGSDSWRPHPPRSTTGCGAAASIF